VFNRYVFPLAQQVSSSLPIAILKLGSIWGQSSIITMVAFNWISLLSHCKCWSLPFKLSSNFLLSLRKSCNNTCPKAFQIGQGEGDVLWHSELKMMLS
jgi:hypothetical protein